MDENIKHCYPNLFLINLFCFLYFDILQDIFHIPRDCTYQFHESIHNGNDSFDMFPSIEIDKHREYEFLKNQYYLHQMV